MTTKEISLENIKSLGFVASKSARGKGLEIFNPENVAFHEYKKYDDDFLAGIELERALEAIEKYATDVHYELGLGEKFVQVKTKDEALEKLPMAYAVRIMNKAKFIGYISLSKYKGDLTDQKKLATDLYTLGGYSVGDEFLDSCNEDFNDIKIFREEHNGIYCSGNYALVHGSNATLEEDKLERIDGRISNYNESVIDDFWGFEFECDKDYFKELDPKETVAVFHRKGKDWYVSPSLEENEIYLTYKDEEQNLYEEEYFKILLWKEDKELIAHFEEVIKGSASDCEMKGYISNELERGNAEASDNIFNLELIDAFYKEDRYEAFRDIMDHIDFKKYKGTYNTEEPLVRDAYDKWLRQNVIGTEYDDGRVEGLNVLASEMGYMITETPIPGTQVMQTCLKYKSEEYHFSLGELFGTESVEEFFSEITKKLQKRLVEKMEHSALLEKAQHVFVGLDDSYDSGNCKSGTQSFCVRNHINTNTIGGLRGDALLEIEISNFTKRAVMAAIVRQKLVA